MLVDITGKGNRVRSVAVPAWVKAAIDAWTSVAGITEGKIFRAVRKGGKIWGQDLTPGAVLQIVQQYARAMGLEKLAPHDLRRTCAKLCRKPGRRPRANKIPARPRVDSDHGAVLGG